jgi:hypothetical protein
MLVALSRSGHSRIRLEGLRRLVAAQAFLLSGARRCYALATQWLLLHWLAVVAFVESQQFEQLYPSCSCAKARVQE